MNRKGFFDQMMTVIIMGIVLGMIIFLIFIIGLAGPILTKTLGDANTVIQFAGQQSSNEKIESATQASFGNANTAIQGMKWLSYFLIIMLLFAFILMAFFVRTYPFLAFIWIFVIIILVLVSIFLSVVYQDVSTSSQFTTEAYAEWNDSNFILSSMPIIITVIGIIGGILMFMLASRPEEAEATGL